MLDGTHYFECRCGSDEHTVRFTVDKEEGEIYTSIFLSQHRSILKRIFVGIKYVLGYRCSHGHWGNWILEEDDAKRLRDMCEEIIK